MKYLVVLLILFFGTLQTFGQQDYFIYLQTDNNQAFYMRVNNNVYSSTSSGYLLLPRWPDNSIPVTIGFPKNVFPEQQFNIPAIHKDAGYLIKNATDKGWTLVNLQTQAVIANSNPPEEKKNPDLITTRKNDAFSMLLANAVNDTSVLYTVSKPPKPAPPVAVVEEKKPDSIIAVVQDQPKDTAALVKKLPEPKQTDSSQVTKTVVPPVPDINKRAVTAAPVVIKKPAPGKAKKPVEKAKKAVTDTIAIAKKLPAQKQQDSSVVTKTAVSPVADSNKADVTVAPVTVKENLPEKNKKPVADTVVIAKTVPTNTPAKDSAKTVSSRIKQFFKGKNTSVPRKDTIIVAGNSRTTVPAIAKNKTERRDTIIIMSGKKPENPKPIVKAETKSVKPSVEKKADSTQLVKTDKPVTKNDIPKRDTVTNNTLPKKETATIAKTDSPAKKPAEKVTVPVTTPAVVQNKPVMPDTAGSAARKDSLAAIAKKESPRPAAKDSVVIAQAPKRQRPLVNRAAEFLTDTSYIAVFIDESNPVFDTIRVSVPFNEEAAFAKLERPVMKETKPADNIVKDKAPAVAEQRNAPSPKKDSSTTEKPVKDSTAVVTAASAQPAPVKKDSLPAAIMATTTVTSKDSIQPEAGKKQAPVVSNDFKDTATDSDIDKLRVKLMLATTDEDRLALAKKLYRTKCFSVKQVRALSELFKNDEGKYQWLDAVYPYVSDAGNFSSLSDLLKDNYYLNRFRAMLRN